MSSFSHPELQQVVRDLGTTLGDTISSHLGEAWLQRIESVRLAGRASSQGDEQQTQALVSMFAELDDADLLVLARAFSQFLNLANLAEQKFTANQHGVSPLEQLDKHLRDAQIADDDFTQVLDKLEMDLVLTAHPTEVIRRTLIHKYGQLADCLEELDDDSLSEYERARVTHRIASLIAQAWHTDEIRQTRPTPVDEAKWGFAVIENSLWEAVPAFVRELDAYCQQRFNRGVPLDSRLVRISSWMGGDRDGNPNVTARVTEEVLLRARAKAASLFYQDILALSAELSLSQGSQALRERVGQSNEPYRALLRPLLKRLAATRDGIIEHLNNHGDEPLIEGRQWLRREHELLEPLTLCYQSLKETGLGHIADDLLLDTLRRAHCFGLHLLKLDIRQDAERHTQAIGAITRHLELGDYEQWDESERITFLLRELASRRPLFARDWHPSPDVQEVLDTCAVMTRHSPDAFGLYVISMAARASDVLAVQLLLKESGVGWQMPVAPLFETLKDLSNGPAVMAELLSLADYRRRIGDFQAVMIGYSDSAKDAGALAAGWAQYQAQEQLVALAKSHNLRLTLFHGRGGTIGRGGLPAHAAILSQPPGSLDGGFRVTEQGETIRYRFGTPQVAHQSMQLYAAAILEAMLLPPPVPKARWRTAMDQMATGACDNYRSWVQRREDFVEYFRVATPEQELGRLPLGSRPAKRKPSGGIESLRAIPWIFAWAQTRLVLPAWLGVMQAVAEFRQQQGRDSLEDMLAHWPFFASRMSMLEMVFSKANGHIHRAYDERLVPPHLQEIGSDLREQLNESIEQLLAITGRTQVLEDDPQARESMNIRSAYLEPLHYLQIELLARLRSQQAPADDLVRSMMVAIGGIAIGMRNTG